jgi:hypothetical protein
VLGTIIVPVTPFGTGVTVGDAPNCRPFGPTGAPGTIPSEEVVPSEGMTVPTWANAGLQPSKGPTVAKIKNGRMKDSPVRAERLRSQRRRAAASAAVSKAAEAMTLFFMAVDRG